MVSPNANAGLGTLAARAYELLDVVGHPVAQERLVQHVFGLTGLRRPEFWRGQLTRLLAAHDLFAQLPDGSWALAAWTSASATLRSLRYVVVDVETTGLSPRTPKFVKRYADVAGVLGQAARAFATDVAGGTFPDAGHSYR